MNSYHMNIEEIRDTNPILADALERFINTIASRVEIIDLYLPDFFPHIYPLLSNLQDRTRDAEDIAVERKDELIWWAKNQRAAVKWAKNQKELDTTSVKGDTQ